MFGFCEVYETGKVGISGGNAYGNDDRSEEENLNRG